jgi:tetratricopeptide (TPR) repeat protein
MHRSRHILFIALLLTTLAAPVWAQSGLLRGTVEDSDGKPIPNAQITVTSDQLSSFHKSLTTDTKGEFKIRFQTTQTQYLFNFLFEKPGFQSFTQPVSPSATAAVRKTFVMDKAESQVVESHGDLAAVVTGSSNVAVEAFNAGLSAQRAGDLPTARANFEEALEADNTLAPAQIALAQVLADLGEHERALEQADKALALSGNRAEALRIKYQALRALGRGTEADAVGAELELAEDAVATARRHYNEGGEAFQAGDQEAALARFQKAAELDPSLVDAHHAVATLELGKGNYEASAKAAETALSMGSEDVRTLRVLYDAYDALGRMDELTEIAPRLAAVDPEFGGAKLIEQAAGLWNTGQAEKAVTLSTLALAIDPTIAKAHYFLGLNHLSNGNNAEAKSALEKFIGLAPDDPDAATAREMLAYIE